MEEVRNLSEVRRPRGYLVFVPGFPTALVAIVAIGNIWASCDVGVNAQANAGFLMYIASPLIWFATTVSWAVLYGVIARFNRRAALIVGTVFNLWFLWFLIAYFGADGTYPDPICPGNVPPWWPNFIPI
ncbi:hypothetical protein [Planotetraspora kaengkrachanensis]|nr:hypothetical protein [Planotetraspora kaengkrachanensis]